jgi:hypothetical protein
MEDCLTSCSCFGIHRGAQIHVGTASSALEFPCRQTRACNCRRQCQRRATVRDCCEARWLALRGFVSFQKLRFRSQRTCFTLSCDHDVGFEIAHEIFPHGVGPFIATSVAGLLNPATMQDRSIREISNVQFLNSPYTLMSFLQYSGCCCKRLVQKNWYREIH